MKDWQIAEAAEATLRPAADLLKELGINDDEWDAYGRHLAKVDVTKVLRRLGGGDAAKAPKRAKYIDAMSGSSQMEAIPVIMDLLREACK